MTIDKQAIFITEVHRLLRHGKAERKEGYVREASALIDSAEFLTLPEALQVELAGDYADALYAVTGALL